MTRKIALLLGNGNYAAFLQRRLRHESDIACMTISLFPHGMATVVDDQVDMLGGLFRPTACIRQLRRAGITHVVLGGDVRLAGLGMRERLEVGARAFADPILRDMVFCLLRGSATAALNVFSKAIASRDIEPLHAAEVLPELKVPEGLIVRHGALARWPRDKLDAHVARLTAKARSELQQQPFGNVRQALLFDKNKIRLREARGTDLLLIRAASEAKHRMPRTLVKLCPSAMDHRMDPPVVGLKTFELAAAAGVDLAILDVNHGILAERDEVLKCCETHGISLFGHQPS